MLLLSAACRGAAMATVLAQVSRLGHVGMIAHAAGLLCSGKAHLLDQPVQQMGLERGAGMHTAS
jgi:hypothetical protein